MKKLLIFMLLTIGTMVAMAPASAQESIDFRSKRAGRISYSLETVVNITENGEPITEGMLADLVMDFYDTVFHSKGANQLAVQLLKARASNEILAIQWTEEGNIKTFRMWTPEFGWMKATRKSVKILNESIPDYD